MSDKQRADHAQAKYWNGFITRTEAQKVFDEQQKVIMGLMGTVQKLDTVIAYFGEKFGVKVEDIQAWLKVKADEASKTPLEKAVDESDKTCRGTVDGSGACDCPKLVTEA